MSKEVPKAWLLRLAPPHPYHKTPQTRLLKLISNLSRLIVAMILDSCVRRNDRGNVMHLVSSQTKRGAFSHVQGFACLEQRNKWGQVAFAGNARPFNFVISRSNSDEKS